MKETLVSYKLAQLAKELGFNWECNHVYRNNLVERLQYYEGDANGVIKNSMLKYNSTGVEDYQCVAPTQELLHKWLRDTKGIIITIQLDTMYCQYCWVSYIIKEAKEPEIYDDAETNYDVDIYSYEEVIEDALKSVLQTIKNEN